ncbi:hypothetical protein C8F01DRAFT_1088663 [Mycena amicta]|nr:hypothetical protein C8F01DRAFT_1088663 [Mycena amicta]
MLTAPPASTGITGRVGITPLLCSTSIFVIWHYDEEKEERLHSRYSNGFGARVLAVSDNINGSIAYSRHIDRFAREVELPTPNPTQIHKSVAVTSRSALRRRQHIWTMPPSNQRMTRGRSGLQRVLALQQRKEAFDEPASGTVAVGWRYRYISAKPEDMPVGGAARHGLAESILGNAGPGVDWGADAVCVGVGGDGGDDLLGAGAPAPAAARRIARNFMVLDAESVLLEALAFILASRSMTPDLPCRSLLGVGTPSTPLPLPIVHSFLRFSGGVFAQMLKFLAFLPATTICPADCDGTTVFQGFTAVNGCTAAVAPFSSVRILRITTG